MHVQSNRTRTRVHLYCTHSISAPHTTHTPHTHTHTPHTHTHHTTPPPTHTHTPHHTTPPPPTHTHTRHHLHSFLRHNWQYLWFLLKTYFFLNFFPRPPIFLPVQNRFYPSKWWVERSLHRATQAGDIITFFTCIHAVYFFFQFIFEFFYAPTVKNISHVYNVLKQILDIIWMNAMSHLHFFIK